MPNIKFKPQPRIEVNLGDVNGHGRDDTLVVENFGQCAHGRILFGEGNRSTFYIQLYQNQSLGNISYDNATHKLQYAIHSSTSPIMQKTMDLNPYFELRIDSHAHQVIDTSLTHQERVQKIVADLKAEIADLDVVIADREARISRLQLVIGHYTQVKARKTIEKEEPYFANNKRREVNDESLSVLLDILRGELEPYQKRRERALTSLRSYDISPQQ